MAYALDLFIGLICLLSAAPLLTQLRRAGTFKRFVDDDGNPVDVEDLAREAMREGGGLEIKVGALNEEMAVFPGRNAEVPEGEGWQSVDAPKKNLMAFVQAGFGLVLILGAISLAFSMPWPSRYVARALFAAAGLILVLDFRRLVSMIGQGPFHPVALLLEAFIAFGLLAGLRLY